MKRCPRCNARFDDGLLRCPHDAATLVDVGDPMLGRTLADRYRLVHRIGAGGMGTVYRAQHLLLRRDVALKLLAPELTRDPVMRERFLREAQATHMLRHPNIVEVYDVAVDGSRVFLVMELLEGDCLASWVGGGPMDVQLALRVVRPVVAALARAHAHGVVHRDIKPENIFVARRAAAPPEDMVVKVLDFGIAHLRHEARLTAPGEVFGTPEYLAPELARGEACQPASDLYAVGVMLFELVTGSLPFDGDLAHIVAHHRDAPPPSARARNPAVPAALDALIVRLMDKDPAARAECAAALGRAARRAAGRGRSAASGRARAAALGPSGRRCRRARDRGRRRAQDATLPRALPTPPTLATLRQRRRDLRGRGRRGLPRRGARVGGRDAPVAQRGDEGPRRGRVAAPRRGARDGRARAGGRRSAGRCCSTPSRRPRARRRAPRRAAPRRGAVSPKPRRASRRPGTTRSCSAGTPWGSPARHGAPSTTPSGQQLEALGAEAAALARGARRRRRADARSAPRHAAARPATRLRALAEARDALEAHEEATRQADEASRADSAHTGIEIDTLYGFVAGELRRAARAAPARRAGGARNSYVVGAASAQRVRA